MKKIDTLVEDIYGLFTTKVATSGEAASANPISREAIELFCSKLSDRISSRLGEERAARSSLRLSNAGTPCDRKLWYNINRPETGEALPPEAHLKFLFGDILEEMLLWLAKMAGHDVQGEQDELRVEDVVGHRDAVIDGVTVDVKSASSYSFNKFSEHLRPDSDAFGYITQLDTYTEAGKDDPLVLQKDTGAFLVIDKTLGKLCLDVHEKRDVDYKALFDNKRQMLASPSPPERSYRAEPDGASGNLKLGIACSYCQFKHECWPGLRTFLYSYGPRFLTRVEKLPNVPEVK